jgi:hypothetical protein
MVLPGIRMDKAWRLMLLVWGSFSLMWAGNLQGAQYDGFEFNTRFYDGMSVPAYKLINVSGVGNKGTKIDVKLLKKGATVTMARATINESGIWQVSLRQQPPSGPYQISISDGTHRKVINDLYVGRQDFEARNPMGGIILSTHLKDGMLLQPHEAIKVSGLAEPGRTIDIKLKRENETLTMARVQVDRSGHWQVTMAGQKAGGPFSLSVTDSTHYETVRGIIIGHADVKAAPEVKQKLASSTLKEQSADAVEPELTDAQGKRKNTLDMEKPAVPETSSPKQAVTEPEKSQPLAKTPSKATQIKNEFLQPQFDDLAWPLVNLNALESVPNNAPLVARKHVHFAIEPQEVSLSVGQANQIQQIYINGQALDSDEWRSNPLKIKVPSDLFRSGDNVIALVSLQEWDNTRFIGKSGRFNLSIDQFNLELSNNWSVFHAGVANL